MKYIVFITFLIYSCSPSKQSVSYCSEGKNLSQVKILKSFKSEDKVIVKGVVNDKYSNELLMNALIYTVSSNNKEELKNPVLTDEMGYFEIYPQNSTLILKVSKDGYYPAEKVLNLKNKKSYYLKIILN